MIQRTQKKKIHSTLMEKSRILISIDEITSWKLFLLFHLEKYNWQKRIGIILSWKMNETYLFGIRRKHSTKTTRTRTWIHRAGAAIYQKYWRSQNHNPLKEKFEKSLPMTENPKV